MSGESLDVGVSCGRCGNATVYMETCENQRDRPGHFDVIGSECKTCGLRNDSPDLRCSICESAGAGR